MEYVPPMNRAPLKQLSFLTHHTMIMLHMNSIGTHSENVF